MEKLLKTHKVEIEVLSPLHIGSGKSLLREFDFAIDKGQVYLFDVERILESLPLERLRQWQRQPVSQLISREQWSKFSLEVLPLKGQPEVTPKEFSGFIRDANRRPYLPASSLKGSLRTVLLYHKAKTTLGSSIPEELLTPSGRPDKRYAAQPLERKILRPGFIPGSQDSEANYDLLRLLHVRDGFLKQGKAEVYQVFWVGRGRSRHLTWAECLSPGAVFETSLQIDLFLLNPEACQRFKIPRNWRGVDFLVEIARMRAKALLKQEGDFFTQAKETAAAEFCFQLLKQLETFPGKVFLLPLGWGTGWSSKTLDDLLSEQALQRWGVKRPQGFRLAGPPANRLPLGWVKVHIG